MRRGVEGVRYRSRNGKDIIAVIEGTERPAAVTALHELGHQMQAEFPEDYATFAEAVRQELDSEKYADWEFARRANSQIPESDPDKLFDEFCNDLAGAQAERQEFWKNVLKKIPDVARRMAEILGRIIRRIGRNLRKSSLPPRRKAAVEGVIRDLPRVRAVLEDVVASVAAKTEARRNAATAMPPTVQAARFSTKPRGNERREWSEVRKGDNFNSIKRLMPMDNVDPKRLDARGIPDVVADRIVVFLKKNHAVTAFDGRNVLLANPERGSLKERAKHLCTRKDERGIRTGVELGRAELVAAIPDTLRLGAISVDQGGDVIYYRKYKGGLTHKVVTDNAGNFIDHEADGGLVTHYPVDMKKERLSGQPKVRSIRPAPYPVANSGGVDVSDTGRQPGDQAESIPTTRAQSDSTTPSAESQATDFSAREDYEAGMERLVDGRIRKKYADLLAQPESGEVDLPARIIDGIEAG